MNITPTPTLDPLSCQELVELITDYLEHALPPELEQRFEVHVGGCGGCRAYLEQMRQTIATTGRLSRESLTPEAERALLAAFRDWRS